MFVKICQNVSKLKKAPLWDAYLLFRDTYVTHAHIIIIMYLYSAQYLHILQDSKRYLTYPTVQVQPQLTSN